MLPFLHKYITASPSSSSIASSHNKGHKKHKYRKHSRRQSSKKESLVTSSSDTVHSQLSISSVTSKDEHKYSELPSTSESKVIYIKTRDDLESETWTKKRQYMQYWTVSIASKHNDIFTLKHDHNNNNQRITMGFGICDATNHDELELNTNAMLKTSNYGYGYCITYSDHEKYQSYHTKLKSLDDILIAFNGKTKTLTLWQNGKRFNRLFNLEQSKIYGFGIKLYGNDYCIKILPNTGN